MYIASIIRYVIFLSALVTADYFYSLLLLIYLLTICANKTISLFVVDNYIIVFEENYLPLFKM